MKNVLIIAVCLTATNCLQSMMKHKALVAAASTSLTVPKATSKPRLTHAEQREQERRAKQNVKAAEQKRAKARETKYAVKEADACFNLEITTKS